jgi:hypothetical protein
MDATGISIWRRRRAREKMGENRRRKDWKWANKERKAPKGPKVFLSASRRILDVLS